MALVLGRLAGRCTTIEVRKRPGIHAKIHRESTVRAWPSPALHIDDCPISVLFQMKAHSALGEAQGLESIPDGGDHASMALLDSFILHEIPARRSTSVASPGAGKLPVQATSWAHIWQKPLGRLRVIFPRSPTLVGTPEEPQQADDFTKMLPECPGTSGLHPLCSVHCSVDVRGKRARSRTTLATVIEPSARCHWVPTPSNTCRASSTLSLMRATQLGALLDQTAKRGSRPLP